MRRFLLAIVPCLLWMLPAPAQAQDALVVAACGTLPQAYSPGSTQLQTVDVTGKLCSNASGGGGGGNVSNSGTPTSGQVALWTSATTIQGVTNLPIANLGGGTGASSTTFWRGDGTWAVPAGGGSFPPTGCAATNGVVFNNAAPCDTGFTYAGSGGAVALTGTLALPNTTSATAGVITFGGLRYFHIFGTNNLFIGSGAGNFTTSGTGGNVVVGSNAGAGLTTGNNNFFLGTNVGQGISTGNGNVAIGSSALAAPANGSSSSVAIGTNALLGSTGGGQNVAIGSQVGADITTGVVNTIIGTNTGRGITTGSFNIILGGGGTSIPAATTNTVIFYMNNGTLKAADYNFTTATAWTFNGLVGQATIYSAAGTPLPACAAATNGYSAIVSDATTPTYRAAYVSGGALLTRVLCVNGTGWLTL